jgi:hypothetical protein
MAKLWQFNKYPNYTGEPKYVRLATAECAVTGVHNAGLYTCNWNIFRLHDFLSEETGFNKNSVFLTIDQDWSGRYKEFDPLPISVHIMTSTEQLIAAIWLLQIATPSKSAKLQHAQIITNPPYKKNIDFPRKGDGAAQQKTLMKAK